jgi:hypothetical protein
MYSDRQSIFEAANTKGWAANRKSFWSCRSKIKAQAERSAAWSYTANAIKIIIWFCCPEHVLLLLLLQLDLIPKLYKNKERKYKEIPKIAFVDNILIEMSLYDFLMAIEAPALLIGN